MEIISKAILSFFDIVEAEGRVFREKAIVVMEGVIMMWLGVALILIAILAAGGAIYMWLRCYIGAPASALAVAVLFAVCGALVLSKGRTLSRNGGGPAE